MDTVEQGGYGFLLFLALQSALLVIKHGFVKTLPNWVAWFPTIVIALLLFVTLIIFLIVWTLLITLRKV